MVIFGASGDLTYRKLIPALYDLAFERLLPAGFSVIGFAHRDFTTESFREHMREGVQQFARRPFDAGVWEVFQEGLTYIRGSFGEADNYPPLQAELKRLDTERGTLGNRLYYLATPPDFYQAIIEQLGERGMNRGADGTWQRIIVEKPFGEDLESARELNVIVNRVFRERDVFRIDHYLGKETVQNILAFRFGNGIYEPLWNRHFVDHVQIFVAESIGIEGRGPYYEGAGAMRDMVQNHMLQLLSLVAMEPPVSLQADTVRDEKVKVLHAVRRMDLEMVRHATVRGQYTAGYVSGERVPGYSEEERVDPRSTTETYVALQLFVDSWRWAGVPFYLRTGKRLAKRISEIAIQFKPAPHTLFQNEGPIEMEPNILALEIQPDEGINLRFKVKVPGPRMQLRPVNMAFKYGSAFSFRSPEAYERLLLDAMLGDGTLFTRRDEVEAAWDIVDSIIAGWDMEPVEHLPGYEAGGWGPDEADLFLANDGRNWRKP